MKYNSSCYTKEKFINKFQKLLDERYADKPEHKRRSTFCTDYESKFQDDNDIKSAVKQWFSLGNNNTRKPSIEKLMDICELLNCDIDYFLTEQTEFKKDVANASDVTGLSYKAIENLSKYSRGKTSSQKIDFQFINMLLSSSEVYYNVTPFLASIVFSMDSFETSEIELLHDYQVFNSNDDTKKYFSDATEDRSVLYDYNGRLYFGIQDPAHVDSISLGLIRSLTKLNLKEQQYREKHKGVIKITAEKHIEEYDYLSDFFDDDIDESKMIKNEKELKEKSKIYPIILETIDI